MDVRSKWNHENNKKDILQMSKFEFLPLAGSRRGSINGIVTFHLLISRSGSNIGISKELLEFVCRSVTSSSYASFYEKIAVCLGGPVRSYPKTNIFLIITFSGIKLIRSREERIQTKTRREMNATLILFLYISLAPENSTNTHEKFSHKKI